MKISTSIKILLGFLVGVGIGGLLTLMFFNSAFGIVSVGTTVGLGIACGLIVYATITKAA